MVPQRSAVLGKNSQALVPPPNSVPWPGSAPEVQGLGPDVGVDLV